MTPGPILGSPWCVSWLWARNLLGLGSLTYPWAAVAQKKMLQLLHRSPWGSGAWVSMPAHGAQVSGAKLGQATTPWCSQPFPHGSVSRTGAKGHAEP